ncbi:hypothetical protein C8Q79DRAFT_581238 [Trametes meyenii]|nr:hypothetical protein C8Q79DRAFT_581238 [Trametes meyenii]
MPTLLLGLPAELLLLVGEYTSTAGLASLALVSRSLNELITPTLYSSIELKVFRPALSCLHTISLAPSSLAQGRDLASLVKALRLALHTVDPNPVLGDPSWWSLEDALAKVAARLNNLRSFSYNAPSSLRLNTLVDLLTASSHVLYSLDVALSDDGLFGANLRRPLLSPAFEHLARVSISNLWELPAGYFEYLRHLLVTRADHLQTLSFSDMDEELTRTLLASTTFFALRELCLEAGTFSLPEFPHNGFPRLISLAIRGLEDFDLDLLEHNSVSIPTVAYPVLESLACDVSFLPIFLPNDGDRTRRPIHTVQLNHASYERNGGGHSAIAPEWEEVSAALSHLTFSGVPVGHLAFNTYRLSLDNLSRLLPSLKDLESLVMVIVYEPEFRSNDAIRSLSDALEGMTHLHTLLFSDAPMKTEDEEYCFTISFAIDRQRDIVRQWSERAAPLRRVAFTMEKEWVRRGEEWVLITE